ncbi:MAG: hypothetical protein LBG13_03335, partial [Holosporales bacterium]|nr:hypothetical protein [Holosporales bacterium]
MRGKNLIAAGLVALVGMLSSEASMRSLDTFAGYRTTGPDPRIGKVDANFTERVLESEAKYIVGAFAALGIQRRTEGATDLDEFIDELANSNATGNLSEVGKLNGLGERFHDELGVTLEALDIHEFK